MAGNIDDATTYSSHSDPPRVALHGGGVMVWAGISSLVFIEGNLNGQRYIGEFLWPPVLLFLRQMPDSVPIFKYDKRQASSSPYRRWLSPSKQRDQIGLARYDSRFILHVWDVLGRAV